MNTALADTEPLLLGEIQDRFLLILKFRSGLNGHESEQTLGDGEGQGSLACCGPWGAKSQT